MTNRTFLITGGAGFFGGILKRSLLNKGFSCISIDLERDEDSHKFLTSVQGDIREIDTLNNIFSSRKIDGFFHCAAMLAHEIKDKTALWQSNVHGTANVARTEKV